MFLGPLAACNCLLIGEKARPLMNLLRANTTPYDAVSVIAQMGNGAGNFNLAMPDVISNRDSLYSQRPARLKVAAGLSLLRSGFWP
jgi:hypothetical protein